MNKDMFEGSEKARIKTLTVPFAKKPTEKTSKTTEKEDVCKFAKGGGAPFECEKSKEGGPENAGVKKPVEKCCGDGHCEEAANLTFDKIYNQIMEANDGVGLDTQSQDMNLDGAGFNDDQGDLGGGDETLDVDNADPEDIDDEDEGKEGNAEDIANLKIAIKYLKKMVKDMGGDLEDDEDDEDEDLDDLEVPDNDGADEGVADANAEASPAPAAQPAPQQQMQPQQESLQIGAKTNLGPKMSQRANGKLGHKNGKGFKWTGKKYDVSGQAKKAPKSKFGPNMGKTISRIAKGDFIQ